MPTRDETDAAVERLRAAYDNQSFKSVYGDPNASTDVRTLDEHVVAKAFLSHPYGTLKPLEWTPPDEPSRNFWRASSRLGDDYRVWMSVESPSLKTVYGWVCNPDVAIDGRDPCKRCSSIEHGKQLAWEHYSAEMAKAFTPIGVQP